MSLIIPFPGLSALISVNRSSSPGHFSCVCRPTVHSESHPAPSPTIHFPSLESRQIHQPSLSVSEACHSILLFPFHLLLASVGRSTDAKKHWDTQSPHLLSLRSSPTADYRLRYWILLSPAFYTSATFNVMPGIDFSLKIHDNAFGNNEIPDSSFSCKSDRFRLFSIESWRD